MSYFKKVLKWFINIFTTILLLLLALVIYGKATTIFGNSMYPNYFGYTFFSIASGSMEPTLYVNDVILVKINNKDLKDGDVISYSKNKEIVTHRIISISNDTLTVKGDNNNTIDDPIERSQVIGKVVKTFPRLSIWQKVITEPKILAALFVTFLLFDAAISYKGKDEKTKKKKEDKKVEEKKETKEEFEFVKEEPKVEEVKKEEVLMVEEIRAKDTEEKRDALLEVTTVLNMDELRNLYKNSEEEKTTEKIEEEETEEIKKDQYTVRLDLNEINKKIKSKVK